MATLNIKGFPDDLYRELRREAEREHRSIAGHVTYLLEQAVGRRKASLEQLRGLGKEVWAGVDAVEHVRSERRGWGDGE